MSAPYPWLADTWSRLAASRARPAQGLLLCGPAGVGKRALARAWAQALLCESPTADGAACGRCEGCHWFSVGNHPDFRLLALEEKETRDGTLKLATTIDVEQAREVVEFVQLSTHRAGWRVVLIDPADALNASASNALLKVLEEPPPRTSFLLLADRARQLLPTLRSRCQRIDFGLPERSVALAWLQAQGQDQAETRLALAGGAPLAAATELHQGERHALLTALAHPARLAPVAQAETFKTVAADIWHGLAYKWLADLLAMHHGADATFNPDFSTELARLAPLASLPALMRLAARQAAAGRHLAHPLNRALQLEAWLVQYRAVFPSLSAP